MKKTLVILVLLTLLALTACGRLMSPTPYRNPDTPSDEEIEGMVIQRYELNERFAVESNCVTYAFNHFGDFDCSYYPDLDRAFKVKYFYMWYVEDKWMKYVTQPEEKRYFYDLEFTGAGGQTCEMTLTIRLGEAEGFGDTLNLAGVNYRCKTEDGKTVLLLEDGELYTVELSFVNDGDFDTGIFISPVYRGCVSPYTPRKPKEVPLLEGQVYREPATPRPIE